MITEWSGGPQKMEGVLRFWCILYTSSKEPTENRVIDFPLLVATLVYCIYMYTVYMYMYV